ncbi:MAG: efflux RND transporter permease subunit [Pyrinomonadaceae bacterium]|nr:efflux RND transporter permease subunit [Pyrinomonadaceae bacterium]MBP6213362.1 efflux RND transporter permease subunit [Pyrinomonadaceae bacterium]
MKEIGIAGKLAGAFIQSKLTPLIVAASILLGIGAVIMLPREEEPQIIVPMVDVIVQMPGSTAKEVEERVTRPMEKLLWEIPGVEYIYSTSSPGMSMAIIRFKVGQNEEDAIVRLNQKLSANHDLIPQGASQPMIKPRSIDDVPILALTLSSARYDHFTLRRVAAQITDQLKEVTDVSDVKIIGGQRRQIRVLLDDAKMSSRSIAPAAIVPMLQSSNQQTVSGTLATQNREAIVETGSFLTSADDVGNVVVGVYGDRPVYLRDVATIVDGPEEPADYVMFGGTGNGHTETGEARTATGIEPAVTIAVSKRKGTNAIDISHNLLAKVESIKGSFIPADVRVTTTRNYGETAAEKSNELLLHMLIAIASVSALIMFALGFRESGIVAIAIPVTLALTLAVFYFYGYTLNRITLFALIFSIGILVDDAIVVVENMTRHYGLPENKGRPLVEVAIEAVDEVGNPTILATFAVIAAILPMAFVSGLMGPYMRPIPVGASAAMIFSMIVAFVVTPWASLKLLKQNTKHDHGKEGFTTRLYRKVMNAIIQQPFWRYSFLAGVVFLLLASMSLVALKAVKVKMLPFDNKSEFQVIVDMPEGSTLEQTAAVTRELANYVGTVPEVVDYQMYVGTASPYNFNGLVRHYFLRRGPNVADIQVNLASKDDRSAQSHDIAKRVRPALQQIAFKYGANVKVAEVPPGPPVLQTIVAEVYGPNYERQIEIARGIRGIFEQTDGVVDIDWYVEDDQTKYDLLIDKEKAAINGITAEQITRTINLAVGGMNVGLLHLPNEKEDTYINLRLPKADRSSIADIQNIKVVGAAGNMVPVSELVQVRESRNDKSIYHKNLMPVVYVTADVAGTIESPVYAILGLNDKVEAMKLPEGYALERYVASQPFLTDKYSMKWDGEWHITYEVFRDMGIAFAAVMVLIYILVVGWFQSFKTPLTIMAAIPFSLVGILPAHALMGAFFTATSMIGFIAGAGIVVRNSIILVDFVELRMKHGMSLIDAVVDAGAVRFRPMLLTAAAVIVGSAVMLFDPIFQGLAISLMAGEVASLLLSRMAVPVLFYLSERKKHPAVEVRSDVKTVISAVDMSPQSAIALKFAASIADRLGVKLKILNAVDGDVPPYFTSSQIDEIAARQQDAADDVHLALDAFVLENIGTAGESETIVVEETPVAAILEESAKSDTVLIAMGTHGRSGLDKLRFGSVAGAVLRDFAGPVLTVNPHVETVEAVNIKRILCPVDLSPESEKALGYAAELAGRYGAELTVLRVLNKSEKSGKHLDELCDWVPAETREHCQLTEVVRHGHLTEQILEAAAESSSDLIVIGVSHGLFADETLGETTAQILRTAVCPVITVPHK